MRRSLPALLCTLVLSACGSTVQVTGSATVMSGDDTGLGITSPALTAGDSPVTAGGQVPTPTTSVAGGASRGPSDGGPSLPGGGLASLPAGDHSPVQVGFLVIKDVGAAAAALGYSGLSTGSGKRQAEAAAAMLNAHGGIAGHKVQPVVFEADATAEAGQYQTACSTFFDDHKARAVVSIMTNDVVMACAKQHGAPFVVAGVNSLDEKTLAANQHAVITNQPTNGRAAAELVDSLVEQGWFKPTSPTEQVTIGLITHDEPQYATVPGIVSARLKAAGLALRDTSYMPYPKGNSDIARASSSGRATALKFQSEGINRVVTIDSNGFATSWFALGAGSQSYYPRLGMTTLAEPSLEPAVLTPQQLAGAAGIGWAPYLDNAVADQQPVSPRTTECLAAMKRGGEDTSLASERVASMSVCEGAFTLFDLWRSGRLDVPGFQQGIQALGPSYRPASVFGADFRTSRAAVSRYRVLRYEAGCDCFRYSGPLRSFG